LASRIVGESLTDEARQARMVDRFLAEIEQGAGAAGAAGRR
jgi:F-type H+-transporting ATPase subunit b